MNKKTKLTQDALRRTLQNRGNSTVQELALILGADERAVQNMLRRTFGCYVSSFINSPGTGAQQALWRCVEVPENAKRPKGRWDDREFVRSYMKDFHARRKETGIKSVPRPSKPVVMPQPLIDTSRPRTRWVNT
jgi:hypothetical protein